MKRIPSLLIALALGFTTLNAQAGLITDPLGVLSPVIGQGLITDPLGVAAPQPPFPVPSAAPVNVAAASTFLAEVLGSLPADGTLRLSDLFMNPEFFAAAHAAGPAADALRGQIDWLMLTGVILGFDGMDGSDDLREGYIEQENLLREGYIEQENTFRANTTLPRQEPGKNGIILGGPGNDNIILGGPGNDNLLPMTHLAPLAPFNPSIILGGPGNDNLLPVAHLAPLPPFNPSIILGGPGNDNIILGGPGNDNLLPMTHLAPLAPFTPSIILGGPGNDNIILGGPGNDNLSNVSAGHRPN
jgi:Ca2+-binding RTX toxin-like protein